MSSAGDIFLKWVCPALGAVTATLLFSSPLRSIIELNRRRSLGETNALPYAVMLANAVSWMFYGVLIHDFFVYCGNVAGVVLGLFYTMTCYKYSNDKAQDTLTYILMSASSLFFLTGLLSMAAPLDASGVKTLWGAVSVAILVTYYSSPLATLAKVLRQRNSSSLHWALCMMNTINGALWFAYGLAVKDWFICIPNGVGAAFNLVCIVMCFIFHRDTPLSDELRRPPQAGADWEAVRVQSIQLSPEDAAKAGDLGRPPASNQSFLDIAQMRWRSARGFQKANSMSSVPSLSSVMGGELAAVHEGLDVEAGDQEQHGPAAESVSRPDGASSSAGSAFDNREGGDDLLQLPATDASRK